MRAFGVLVLVLGGSALLTTLFHSLSDSRARESTPHLAPTMIVGLEPSRRTPYEDSEIRHAVEESETRIGADEPQTTQELGYAALAVNVVSRETGKPLAGIRLMSLVEDMEEDKVQRFSSTNRGTEHEVLITGDDGMAIFSIPAGRQIELDAWDEKKGAQRLRIPIEPLVLLETRAVLVELSTQHDLVYLGETSIQVSPRNEPAVGLKQNGLTLDTTSTDRNRRFQFLTDSWRNPYLRIEVEDFTPALVHVTKDHATESTRERIELVRAASLLVRVYEGLQPVPGIEVVATTTAEALIRLRYQESWPCPETFVWVSTTDENGVCKLSDLPAQVSLGLALDGFGLQRIDEAVTLAPRERRELTLALKPPVELRGKLVDQYGEPVAHKEIWLCEANGDRLERWACEFGPRVRSMISDVAGLFSFPAVYEGRYWIGPCPECPPIPPSFAGSSNEQHVVPKMFLVDIQANKDNFFDLEVDRELYLRGVVFEEHGWKVPKVSVEARSIESEQDRFQDTTDENAAFEIGPLQHGSYERSGMPFQYPHDSTPFFALAETDDIVLRIKIKSSEGRISGFVVDPENGKGVDAQVSLEEGLSSLADPARQGMRPSGDPALAALFARYAESPLSQAHMPRIVATVKADPVTGAFVFEDISATDYTVWAHNSQKMGQQQVSLSSRGGCVDGVMVYLRPGAELVVETGQSFERIGARGREDEWRLLLLDRREKQVLEHSFQGSRAVVAVPPGDYSAQLEHVATGAWDEEHIALGFGRTKLRFHFWD